MHKITLTTLFAFILFIGCKTPKEIASPATTSTPTKTEVQPRPSSNNFPAIMIKERGDTTSVPLAMSELDVSVKVVGNIAVTTLDMTFSNHLDRILEGQLYFPLGEGQTVSRFAMDVNGKLREGVVVEKEKGRVTYENTVRQAIDPGLLEWVKGNNFKARIYPIPANGHKRIVIAYEQELTYEQEGWIYLLPLNFQDTVDKFSLGIRVFKQKIAPRFENNELANLSFSEWEESYIAEKTYENYLPNRQLGILVPRSEKNRKAWTESISGKGNYFYLSTIPPISTQEKVLPKRIGILWDHSHSAGKRNLEKEMEILDRYFQQIQNFEVSLIPFANSLDAGSDYKIKNGNWAKLKEAITSMPNDGATQFGVLNLIDYSPDEFILLSDGNSNFGSAEIKLGSKPVFVINSTEEGNHPFLNYIAETTGGQYINAGELTTDAAVNRLSLETYRFISADYREEQFGEVFPSRSTPVNSDFSMSGKIKASAGEITLNFGIGDKVMHSETISISQNKDKVEKVGLDRMWAQKKLTELLVDIDRNEEEITELGKSFSVVTPTTSLIVLDRVEDYAEQEIEPPAELKEEYDALIAQRKKNEKTELLTHLDLVAENFQARTTWWAKEFEIPKGSVKKPKSKKSAPRRSLEDGFADSSDSDDDFGGADEGEVEEAAMDLSFSESDSDADGVADFMDAEPEVQALAFAIPEPSAEEVVNPEEVVMPQLTTGEIKINTWNPETPYTKELQAAAAASFYTTYLKLKKDYASTPAFFLDVANLAYQDGDSTMALRILSNIAELELENHELLRVLARRLQQIKEYELAISMFREILKIRGEEPQSYRDLGLALAETGESQEAIDMLYEVVKNEWNGRFPNIEVLVAHEMNAVIGKSKQQLKTDHMDKRLVADLPTDIRVVLDWDADAVDMDLWVTDPRGEKCYYQHKNTVIGGMMSSDFTGGYGPEEFLLKKAMKGAYNVQVNYYGSSQQRIAGPTNIQMRFITNYGNPNEKTQSITIRLASESEVIDVGELVFE